MEDPGEFPAFEEHLGGACDLGRRIDGHRQAG
jgi:hypothetical protein